VNPEEETVVFHFPQGTISVTDLSGVKPDRNYYYVPKSGRFSAFDSFSVGYGFQMTVAKEHPIDRTGFLDVFQRFCVKGEPFGYYFIVPESLFVSFNRPQRFQGKAVADQRLWKTSVSSCVYDSQLI